MEKVLAPASHHALPAAITVAFLLSHERARMWLERWNEQRYYIASMIFI
jgi:hypothetical protein